MMNQVKAQVKTAGKATPGLSDTFYEMDRLLELLLDDLKEDHDQTQIEINDLYDDINNDEAGTAQAHIDATNKDIDLVACRSTEKEDLKRWEECVESYEECKEIEDSYHEDVVENDTFEWEIDADNQCKDGEAVDCKECFLLRDSKGGLDTSLTDCTDYSSLYAEYYRITDEFITHWGTFKGLYDKWETKHIECVGINENCEHLLDIYVQKNTQCDILFGEFKTLACDYGDRLKDYCAYDKALRYFEEVVNSSADVHAETGLSHSPTGRSVGISEVDRLYEFDAIWTIRCMIRAFDLETGLMTDDDIAACAPQDHLYHNDAKTTYESRVGSMIYKWWMLNQHFNCYEEVLYVTFSGKAWTIGHHSMFYQEYDFVFVVHPTLDNPTSTTKAFAFCNQETLQFYESHLTSDRVFGKMITTVPVVCPSVFDDDGIVYHLEQRLEREGSETNTNGQEGTATTRNYEITVYKQVAFDATAEEKAMAMFTLPAVTCEVDSKLYNFDEDTAGFSGAELAASTCENEMFTVHGKEITCTEGNDRLVIGDCNGDGVLDRFCTHYPNADNDMEWTALRLSGACDAFPQEASDPTFQWGCLDFWGYDTAKGEFINADALLYGEGEPEQSQL